MRRTIRVAAVYMACVTSWLSLTGFGIEHDLNAAAAGFLAVLAVLAGLFTIVWVVGTIEDRRQQRWLSGVTEATQQRLQREATSVDQLARVSFDEARSKRGRL